MAKQFREALPTLNAVELENAWKCLGLAYLGMHEEMWATSAAVLLKMECAAYMKREVELNAIA